MKKFLLVILTLFFTLSCANATTTVVRYNNAGMPVTIARGYSAPVSIRRYEQYNRYARRARPSLPSRPALPYGYRTRHAHIPPSITNYNFPAPVQSAVIKPTSRLNKNYSVSLPQKSYTLNGVTYYN